jgi:hypothetical protein
MNKTEQFSINGYVYVPNFAEPSIVSAVSKYALLKEAYSFNPDTNQVINAHAVYADFLMESLLLDYKKSVETITGLNLIPTYSFYRVYRRGQELTPHIDRPACEISVSVCYEYDYRGKDYEWPLVMNSTPIAMKPGDGAVYRGIDINHFRPVFNVPQDSYHIQGFYHYVNADGPWTSHAYDKKENSHLNLISQPIVAAKEESIENQYEQYRVDEARAFVRNMSK